MLERSSLGSADIHVWTIDLDRPPRLASVCSDDELARAARLVRERDRCGFLSTRGALRVLIGRYCGANPAALRFKVGAWGKPALDGSLDPPIEFNVSHSGATALIALARERAVGVDVETVRPMAEGLGITRRMFGAEPHDLLARLEPTERTRAFFRLWTAHEACVKALGAALASAAATLRMDFNAADPVCTWVDPAVAPHGLALAPLEVGPGRVASIAWRRRGSMVEDAARIASFSFAE